ncbi:MAG: A/G-specific adenine glycosylase [Clostridia bacterium]|nr:A/G-specific adenine glycosylase [Clostridia bacterium]
MTINASLLKQIPKPLLSWYDREKRVLPWRENKDPYRVWVSEIMLQQTRVEAVIDYYNRFLKLFPTVEALAEAPTEQVLKAWEGLGYYSRARNLQKAAQMVVSDYNGIFPKTAKELLKLPGIGRYTAGAVSSIAYDSQEPAVDGNVLRVIMRILACDENVSKDSVKTEVEEIVRGIIPARAGDFNQSLMELGALVCLPNGAPLCEKCPLAELCEGRRQGIAEQLPNKTQKKERTIEQKTVFVIEKDGRAALRKREEKGLLAGMWEFPNCVGALDEKQAKEKLASWGISGEMSKLESAVHIFTHREWHMSAYFVHAQGTKDAPFVWADEKELKEQLTVPAAFSAFVRQLKAEWRKRK